MTKTLRRAALGLVVAGASVAPGYGWVGPACVANPISDRAKLAAEWSKARLELSTYEDWVRIETSNARVEAAQEIADSLNKMGSAEIDPRAMGDRLEAGLQPQSIEKRRPSLKEDREKLAAARTAFEPIDKEFSSRFPELYAIVSNSAYLNLEESAKIPHCGERIVSTFEAVGLKTPDDFTVIHQE